MANHNCIERVRKELMDADPSLKTVRFLLSTITDGKVSDMTGQPIEVSFEKRKKDGQTKTVYQKSFVAHDYCPFCGEKYKKQKP